MFKNAEEKYQNLTSDSFHLLLSVRVAVESIEIGEFSSVDSTVKQQVRNGRGQWAHLDPNLVHRWTRLVECLESFRHSVQLDPDHPTMALPEPNILVDVPVGFASLDL